MTEAARAEPTLYDRAFGWRTHYGFGRPEAVILAIYTAILTFTIAYHEQWSDEAQAWLLARDCSFHDLFFHRLHYEGAPAAWHFLLRLFHLAGGTWTTLNWFAGLFAIAGTAVLLRWSPFPAAIRYLLPFTFYLQYQYAVIARSYVLFPLLLWAICALFTASPRRPILFALVAGLLANINLQGSLASVTLAALYFWSNREEHSGRGQRRKLSLAVAILLCSWSVALYVALPAPDVGFAVIDKVEAGPINHYLVNLLGEAPRVPPQIRPPQLPPPATISAGVPRALPLLETRPSWLHDPLNRIVWEENGRSFMPEVLRLILENLISFLSQTTWAISNSNLHACLFLILTVIWAHSRQQAKMLLPYMALLVLGTVIWVADHHTGLALITLLVGFWLVAKTFPGRACNTSGIERAFILCFFSVVLLQVAWTAVTVERERFRSYSPGPETGRFLQQFPARTTMAGFGYHVTAIEPWFASNPFFNLGQSYWFWSSHVDPNAHDRETIARRPDVVVYAWETTGSSPMRNQWVPQDRERGLHDLVFDDLIDHGYKITHMFCGERFARFGTSNRVCNLILEPSQPIQALGQASQKKEQ